MLLLALGAVVYQSGVAPSRVVDVSPVRLASFEASARQKPRVQGWEPRSEGSLLVFEATRDGNRQIDPQIAVGGGYVFHPTNTGSAVFDRGGRFVLGTSNDVFLGGIDPKLVFDPVNRVFCYDIWKYYDNEKLKPVHFAISETDNPLGAWNVYPVSIPDGVDGGSLGVSRQWLGYSFPGGKENTIIMPLRGLTKGKATKAYFFEGNFGQPVCNQDAADDLFFVALNSSEIVIRQITMGGGGEPRLGSETRVPHLIPQFRGAPQSPQKGTENKTASGGGPKNAYLQSDSLWFCLPVNEKGRSAIRWFQVSLSGTIVQQGLLSDPVNSFIQPSIAVNKRGDMLVGFQETGPGTFISARYAYRLASDPRNTLRSVSRIAEGVTFHEGGAWGDYSDSCVDGDNMLDMWTAQTIVNETGKGSTVIARLRLSGQ